MNIKLLHPKARVPTRATEHSAGFDLYTPYDLQIRAQHRVSVPLGIAIEIPEGMCGLVCSRSGLERDCDLVVGNAPGIIDSDYRGEVSVSLYHRGARHVRLISEGSRIAQLVLVSYAAPELVVVDELAPTARGDNGFGSSGA